MNRLDEKLTRFLYFMYIPISIIDFIMAIMVFFKNRDWLIITLFISMGVNFLLEFLTIHRRSHKEEPE
ncbi:hypothetical protein EFM12_00910 [Latilactobacillus curvatus]|nr:hypothetical protein CGZ47_05995 [Latilactobacillus curvatus]MCT2879531.1 hypothetical protein [Latilactobacillus curvatus]